MSSRSAWMVESAMLGIANAIPTTRKAADVVPACMSESMFTIRVDSRTSLAALLRRNEQVYVGPFQRHISKSPTSRRPVMFAVAPSVRNCPWSDDVTHARVPKLRSAKNMSVIMSTAVMADFLKTRSSKLRQSMNQLIPAPAVASAPTIDEMKLR
eukprot:Amastigsp_a677787_38.p3 type:complete len:155 gc:universal Amastigsp_a677787_38:1036-572(-)